jgi:hypothetical protein
MIGSVKDSGVSEVLPGIERRLGVVFGGYYARKYHADNYKKQRSPNSTVRLSDEASPIALGHRSGVYEVPIRGIRVQDGMDSVELHEREAMKTVAVKTFRGDRQYTSSGHPIGKASALREAVLMQGLTELGCEDTPHTYGSILEGTGDEAIIDIVCEMLDVSGRFYQDFSREQNRDPWSVLEHIALTTSATSQPIAHDLLERRFNDIEDLQGVLKCLKLKGYLIEDYMYHTLRPCPTFTDRFAFDSDGSLIDAPKYLRVKSDFMRGGLEGVIKVSERINANRDFLSGELKRNNAGDFLKATRTSYTIDLMRRLESLLKFEGVDLSDEDGEELKMLVSNDLVKYLEELGSLATDSNGRSRVGLKDPRINNIMLDKDGKVKVIDFGKVGEVFVPYEDDACFALDMQVLGGHLDYDLIKQNVLTAKRRRQLFIREYGSDPLIKFDITSDDSFMEITNVLMGYFGLYAMGARASILMNGDNGLSDYETIDMKAERQKFIDVFNTISVPAIMKDHQERERDRLVKHPNFRNLVYWLHCKMPNVIAKP